MSDYIYARLHRTHGEVDQATLLQADMRELRETIRKATVRIEFERRVEEFMRQNGLEDRTRESA